MKEALVALIVILNYFGCSKPTSLRISKLPGQTIAIQPLNGFTESSPEVLSLQKDLEKEYNTRVVILKASTIPVGFRSFIGVDTAFNADSILSFLSSAAPKEVVATLGITKDLLYTLDSLRFHPPSNPAMAIPNTMIQKPVLGFSWLGGNQAIISTYRASSSDKTVQRERIKKITGHEFGHLFGLQHCETDSCIMSDKNSDIGHLDTFTGKYCPACLRKLHSKK